MPKISATSFWVCSLYSAETEAHIHNQLFTVRQGVNRFLKGASSRHRIRYFDLLRPARCRAHPTKATHSRPNRHSTAHLWNIALMRICFAQMHKYFVFDAARGVSSKLDVFFGSEGVYGFNKTYCANRNQVLYRHTGIFKFFCNITTSLRLWVISLPGLFDIVSVADEYIGQQLFPPPFFESGGGSVSGPFM